MARPGRNDPCHCKSGKKYKRCCGPAEEAADHAKRRAAQDEEMARAKAARKADLEAARRLLWAAHDADGIQQDEAFCEESNAIVGLIHAGQLDEAEARARALIVSAPGATDGLERLGHVYEARGDMKTAARHYREAIALTRSQGVDAIGEFLQPLYVVVVPEPPGAVEVLDGAIS